VAGNGQRELIEAIAGLRKLHTGTISLDGKVINDLNIRQRLNLGISVVPEDRMGMGLVPNLDLLDNIILRTYYLKNIRMVSLSIINPFASWRKKWWRIIIFIFLILTIRSIICLAVICKNC
jgi:simple sugar transport system ATP-binding protein